MSAVTDDLDSSPADLAANRLYDPAFKLFGTTIPVSCECPITSTDVQEPGSLTMAATSGGASSVQDIDDENPESENESFTRDELGSSSGSNDGGDEEKLVELISDQQEVAAVTPINLIENGLNDVCVPNTYEHPQGEEAMEHETPKKPEKPIPCPRCQSLDTKFCYFNNYNVNQPRHFCKNCQRYWTAGGTLRNVPVGAGRRKNKHSSSPHARGTFPDHAVVRGDPPENAQQIISCPSSAQTGMRRQINPAMPPVSTPTHMLPVNLQSVPSFESTQSSAILSFGQESPVRVSTRDPSCTPCQSEVLQGYKQEASPQQATNTFSLPKTGGAQSQLISHAERSHNEVVTGASVDGRYPKLQKFHVKQPATERPLEPEGSVTGTPKSEPSGVGDFPKYIDAALAWATGGPFSFMGLPWQYSAGLGWGAASPPVGHGSAGQIPNTSAGLANVLQGTSTTHNMGVAGSQHGAGFGGQAPWATALGPWAGAIPWSIIQNPVWVPPGWGGPWAMPWAAPLTAAAAAAAAATAAAAAAAAAVNSDVGATTLGKHPREPEDDAGGVKGRPLLVPKTLRIDDPGDAARSSIWSTLGIDPCGDNFTRGGIFKGRQSKADGEINHPNTCTRNSNPAALNRIMTFQESNLTVPTFDIKDT